MSKEDKEGVGEIEGHSGYEITKMLTALSCIYVALSLAISSYYHTQVPDLRVADKVGVLSQTEAQALHYFFDFIGNHFATFNVMGVLVIIDSIVSFIESKIEQHSDLFNAIRIMQTILPWIVVTYLHVSNVDTEIWQRLPFSGGSPHLLDIPAGTFGILSGTLLLELRRRKLGFKDVDNHSFSLKEYVLDPIFDHLRSSYKSYKSTV